MALNLQCDACAAHRRPLPHLPGIIRLDEDFNDSIGVGLFTLADYSGNQLVSRISSTLLPGLPRAERLRRDIRA
eukprot:6920881-Pyramimonas_sp.AAC.1